MVRVRAERSRLEIRILPSRKVSCVGRYEGHELPVQSF